MTTTRKTFLTGTAGGLAAVSSASLWSSTALAADVPGSLGAKTASGMMDPKELQDAVDAARSKHNVPGVSAAFYAGGQLVLASSGVTNVSTGIPMTQDALMHIGSITKIFTTTLVMQLVDEGKVALDRPVIDVMPDFQVGDAEATRTITVGELLNHSSGIDANLLADVGHDKETIENTVTRMHSAPQLHAPGKACSYCNAGMVIAGYLCQQLRGKSWYDLVKERIFTPLGMKQAVVLPEDAVLYRLSVGHFLNPATKAPVRTPLAYLPIGYSPAGSTAMMSASDLMTFGRMHMAKGVGPNGAQILSEASATRMREPFGHVTGPQAFDSAIGWERSPGGLLHHGGGGPGIVAMLVTHPASQTAIVVLTNADYGVSVLADLMKPFLKTRLGLDTWAPAPKALANQTIDAAPYVGIYENSSVVHVIAAKDGRLTWTAYGRASYDRGLRTERLPTKELAAAGDGRFLTSDTTYIKFVDPDASGKSRYLQQDLWLYRRT